MLSHQIPLPVVGNLLAALESADRPELTRAWLPARTKLPVRQKITYNIILPYLKIHFKW